MLLLATLSAAAHAQLAGPGAPPCASAIEDGSRVRAESLGTAGRVTGRALGWGTATPRIVTRRNDTVLVDLARRRELSAGRVARSRKRGALAGFGAGSLTVGLSCAGRSNWCGEQNPIPLLGLLAGAAVGHFVKHEQWVRIPDDSACAARPRGSR